MINPEILAPAGSLETLYAAIDMGADAVYVGAPRFGARAFADNPSVAELERAICDCHIRGKRLYLTVNTLLTDEELDAELLPMLDPLVAAGLDAAIVQDPGVLSRLHEAYPALALHASTQMALFSGEEAELLRPYGVTRFVPARELSIEEIRAARAQTDLEIEVFVHGALCVCYSGWCRMSEHIGGRSGNRGMCAGPCRLPYKRESGGRAEAPFELNTRDIETLLHMPELIDAGIDSFKIEGRMKRREYSAYLAYLYRHYADVCLTEGAEYYRTLVEDPDSVLWQDRKRAMELYNRGGFFSSFLFRREDEPTIEPRVKGHYGLPVGQVKQVRRLSQKNKTADIDLSEPVNPGDVLEIRDKNGSSMYEFTVGQAGDDSLSAPVGYSEVNAGDGVFRTKNLTLLEEIDRRIEEARDRAVIPLTGIWNGRVGDPVQLTIRGVVSLPQPASDNERTVTDQTIKVTVPGETLAQAERRPVTAEDVRGRLLQLGDTGYRFEQLDVHMPEGAFLPLKSIKELRRLAIAAWEKQAGEAWKEATEALTQTSASGRDESAGSINEESLADTYAAHTWISVRTMEQLEAVLIFLMLKKLEKTVLHVKLSGFSALSFPNVVAKMKKAREELPHLVWAFSLPQAYRGRVKTGAEPALVDLFSHSSESEPDSVIFVAGSMASLVFRNRYVPDMPTVADENLYMVNARAKHFYGKMGVSEGPKRRYGRIPVMITAHPIREGVIVTPKGDRFVVAKPEGEEGRVIFTEEPVTDKSGNGIEFSTETEDEVREVLEQWL